MSSGPLGSPQTLRGLSVMLTYGIGEYTGVKVGSTAADLVVPVLLYISVLVIAIGKKLANIYWHQKLAFD